ncbi:hypothetical protein Sjap_012732 [Stephania japonica]|uniref:Uncharacterized protein n=1 Tax=Stephania japonica TaxID=461633 RepID=A0AAP0NZ78_9MAGN
MPFFFFFGWNMMPFIYAHELVIGYSKVIGARYHPDTGNIEGNVVINGFDLKGEMFSLIAGYQEVNLNSCSIEDARKCVADCLIAYKIKGNILLCENATISDAC